MIASYDSDDGEGKTSRLRERRNAVDHVVHVQPRSNYRVGLWSMLTAERSLSEQAELHLVAHVQGDVDDVFRRFDADGSGHLDRHEIKQVVNELRAEAGDVQEASDQDIDVMFEEIKNKVPSWDSAFPDTVSLSEFRIWYGDSAERIREQVIDKFNSVDADGNGKLDKSEITELLAEAHGQTPSSTDVDALW